MEILDIVQVRNIPSFPLILDNINDKVISQYIKTHGFWEELETLVLTKIIHPGNIVLDIGANAGYYSVLFSKAVGEQGKVFAFEPEVNNYKLLKANLLINDCWNVWHHQKAVSDHIGNAKLFLSSDNLGDHRLYHTGERKSYEVSMIPLDFYFSDEHIDFIKIDTQGSELNILRGMKKIIEKNKLHLACLMEFSPGILKLANIALEELMEELNALDARLYKPIHENLMMVTDSQGGRKIDSDLIKIQALNKTSITNMYNDLLAKGEHMNEDILVFFSSMAEKTHTQEFEVVTSE